MRVKTFPGGEAIEQPPDAAPDRILELDGFRALAVWMVFVSHMLKGWPNSRADSAWMPRWLFLILDHGWLGVDLFFILSGLLITGILIDTRDGPRYFSKFYARRSLRILPLYLTCIVLMNWGHPGYGSYFLVCLLFLQNFVFGFGIATPHGPGVFWSLAVEEHFYLIWPLLVRFVSRRAVLFSALTIVLLTPILRGIYTGKGYDIDGQIYVYSWFHFDGLAWGAVLAIWLRSKFFSRAMAHRLALGFGGALLLITMLGYPYGILQGQTVASGALRYTQAQCFFAALMVLSLAYSGSVYTALLWHPFALFSAGLSYCIYLIHVVMGEVYYWGLNRFGVDEVANFGLPGSMLARTVAVFCLSIGVAWLSQRYLEAPFLRLKRYF